MTASPISLTIFTGGAITSSASRESRPATLPSSSTGIVSPSSVKPTRSAKATAQSRPESSRPLASCSRGDHLLPQRLAQVQREHVLEPRAGERQQHRRHRLQTGGELVLVDTALEHRLADQRRDRLDVAGHAAAEHALGLHRLLVGEPGLAVLVAHARRLEVALAVDALVGPRHRQAQHAPLVLEEVQVEAALLGDLARRVMRLRGQQPVDRQQREPLLGDRAAKLLDRHAVGVQLVEQRAARLARAAVDACRAVLPLPSP